MKHKVFSIYDVKAKAYLPPFILPETPMAVRVFGDCVNSDDHQFGKHPGDYTLFDMGVWDDSNCLLVTLPEGVLKVVNGLEVVNSKVASFDEVVTALKPIKGDGGYEGFVKERSNETA